MMPDDQVLEKRTAALTVTYVVLVPVFTSFTTSPPNLRGWLRAADSRPSGDQHGIIPVTSPNSVCLYAAGSRTV
jgi:hypothetical protein